MALAAKSNFGTPEHIGLHSERDSTNLFVVKNKETGVWESLKAGDENALGELYNTYVDALFSYGVNFSNDRGYVMDCIHDLFVDLHKYRKSLSNTDNIKYYLFKSLKRKISKKYHSKVIPVSMEYQYTVNANLRNYTNSHEEDIINGERRSEKSVMLSNALNTLTKKQRKGLFLRFNQQRTYEEIAEIMGVSVQSARTTIYRALKTLR